MNHEARHAGELVLLHRDDLHRQFFFEDGTGKVEAFGGVRVLCVDDGGLCGVAVLSLDGIERLVGRLVFRTDAGSS